MLAGMTEAGGSGTAVAGLAGRRVVLGVTGGIAAYKAADLVRRLREAGAAVRVVMTAGAERFVTPLTFQALSGEPVRRELFDAAAEAAMGHIELARWAEAVLVAPATADFMARIAAGLADDLLATLCLATEAPLLLAPAMNRAMWAHPATQANRRTLAARGVRFAGPAEGAQACGETGPGRMADPEVIVAALARLLAPGPLAGLTVVVTAGPTREPLDPVRYVGNRSSGRMGYALAEAAAEVGARVTLVSGPVALDSPPGVRRVRVETALEMREATLAAARGADLLFAAAAVADYRPARPRAEKLRKSAERLRVELVRNPDIVREVAALPPGERPFVVGFAAETMAAGEALRAAAEAKRRAKGMDMIAANRVGPGLGFEAEDNALEVLWAGGGASLARAPKRVLARRLVALAAERLHAARAAQGA